jgi:hypothetical protein
MLLLLPLLLLLPHACRTAHYCSRACQMLHWPAHKKICKSIGASQGKHKG